MKRMSLIAILICLVFSVASHADVIYFTWGGNAKGDIIYEDSSIIKIQTKISLMTVGKGSVARIERDVPLPEAETFIPPSALEIPPAPEEPQAPPALISEKAGEAELETIYRAGEEDTAVKGIAEKHNLAEYLALTREVNTALQKELISLKEEIKKLRSSITEKPDDAKDLLSEEIASIRDDVDFLKKERSNFLARQGEFDRKLLDSQREVASLKNTLAETDSRMRALAEKLNAKTLAMEVPAPTPPEDAQAAAPDFKELLSLKFPEQTEELAQRVNSFYYNFIDKNVETIRLTISDSQQEDLISKIENAFIGWDIDIAEKIRGIKIVATYRPLSDSLTFYVANRPEFKRGELNEVIDSILIDGSIRIYRDLLIEEMTCLNPLINPEYDSVQSVTIAGDDLVVELSGRNGKSYWTFDKDYRLKSIEKPGAEDRENITQIYEFEMHESKYLIKSLAEKTAARYSKREIEYETVNGIKVPNRLLASSTDTDSGKTDLELYFENIEVGLNN